MEKILRVGGYSKYFINQNKQFIGYCETMFWDIKIEYILR